MTDTVAAPRPETDATLEFLQHFTPDGPWVLAAIPPEGGSPDVKTFDPDALVDARNWIDKYNGQRNLYFQVNPPICGLARKASKVDIKSLSYLHVDIDPRAGDDLTEERQRILLLLTDKLPDGVPTPTCIIYSGGGYQAFWSLEEPVAIDGDLERAEDAERYNRQLEALFGGDSCHNVDRLMRLPGTINIPNEKKRNRGRVPELAQLEYIDDNGVYAIDNFTQAPANGCDAQTGETTRFTGDAKYISDLAELIEWNVPDGLLTIIAMGNDPEHPKTGDNSRSAWLFHAVCGLLREGVPEDIVFGIITDERWAISESVLENGSRARKYARRQIERALAANAADALDFKRDKNDKPIVTQDNMRIALQKLGVSLSHDLFSDRSRIGGLPGFGQILQDEAVTRLWLTIDDRFGFRPGKEFFWMFIEDEARRDTFHPVQEYLDGLEWDGKARIDDWLIRYGGAEDNEFVRAVGALFLIAAVRRIRQPGCKFDEMIVLRSPQGTMKSSALRALVPEEDWFSDDLPLNADTKTVIERLHGRWIVEAAELSGMRKGAVEHLKAFLSRRQDRARMAYGRITKEVPRQCVIAGTTNSEKFLKDNTGNRRFWPIIIDKFDVDAVRRDRDQIWAEAAQREADGQSIRLDPNLYPAATEAQEKHRIEDPYLLELERVLGDHEGKIQAADVWKIIDVPTGQRSQHHNERIGEAMRELGFERKKLRFGGNNSEWCYVRGDAGKQIKVCRGDDGRMEIDLPAPF